MNSSVKYYEILMKNNLLHRMLQFVLDLVFKTTRIINKILPLKRKNICVIAIHKLGDSIFTFDALNSIKKFYGDDVYVICSKDAEPIFELVHSKDFLLSIPKNYFHFGDRYLDRRARKLLRSVKPKIIIDLTGVMTSASLIFNSRAKKIFGFNRKIFRKIYDNFTEFNLGSHSREIYINAIKDVIPIVKFNYDYNLVDNSDKILIAPFAGWKSKEWPLVKYVELALRLKKKYKVHIVFDNRAISQTLKNYLIDNQIDFIQIESVSNLITEIRSCKLLIGNDSGPVQIASLLGKYTFSIYGPTNPKFHLPKGEKHFYIQKKLPCTPTIDERLCFTDGGKNGCPSFECLNLLSVDEVYNTLEANLLSKKFFLINHFH